MKRKEILNRRIGCCADRKQVVEQPYNFPQSVSYRPSAIWTFKDPEAVLNVELFLLMLGSVAHSGRERVDSRWTREMLRCESLKNGRHNVDNMKRAKHCLKLSLSGFQDMMALEALER